MDRPIEVQVQSIKGLRRQIWAANVVGLALSPLIVWLAFTWNSNPSNRLLAIPVGAAITVLLVTTVVLAKHYEDQRQVFLRWPTDEALPTLIDMACGFVSPYLWFYLVGVVAVALVAKEDAGVSIDGASASIVPLWGRIGDHVVHRLKSGLPFSAAELKGLRRILAKGYWRSPGSPSLASFYSAVMAALALDARKGNEPDPILAKLARRKGFTEGQRLLAEQARRLREAPLELEVVISNLSIDDSSRL